MPACDQHIGPIPFEIDEPCLLPTTQRADGHPMALPAPSAREWRGNGDPDGIQRAADGVRGQGDKEERCLY